MGDAAPAAEPVSGGRAVAADGVGYVPDPAGLAGAAAGNGAGPHRRVQPHGKRRGGRLCPAEGVSGAGIRRGRHRHPQPAGGGAVLHGGAAGAGAGRRRSAAAPCRIRLCAAGKAVRDAQDPDGADAGRAAAHRPELPQAQADAPCAGHGAGGGAPCPPLRRRRDAGPHRGAAPRLHEEAGHGGAAGAVRGV